MHYDDNGLLSYTTNNTTGQMRSIDWTFDMLPSVILDFDGTQTNFDYDAFGNRAVEKRGPETIVYFGPLARKSSLTGFTNTYVAGDRVIASKSGGARTWMHHDRNGSVRVVSDAGGQVVGRMNYGAFGEVRLAPGQSNRVAKFDGVDIDGGTGLQYMGARFYDPVLNRFMSPDAIVPDALNTQAMNRYAYNYNNPLAYTDPSGHGPYGVGSSYYGAPPPAAGFDFSVNNFPGLGNTLLGGIALAPVPATTSTPTVTPGQVCSACKGSQAIYATPFDVPPRITKKSSGNLKVIITRDTVFGIDYGSHAALWINNQGHQILYDPSGSFMRDTEMNPGSGAVFTEEGANLEAFIQFHKDTGSRVETVSFNLQSADLEKIIERLEPSDLTNGLGEERGPNCAAFVCRAIQGVGPFKNLDTYGLPGNLQDALKQLAPVPYKKPRIWVPTRPGESVPIVF